MPTTEILAGLAPGEQSQPKAREGPLPGRVWGTARMSNACTSFEVPSG